MPNPSRPNPILSISPKIENPLDSENKSPTYTKNSAGKVPSNKKESVPNQRENKKSKLSDQEKLSKSHQSKLDQSKIRLDEYYLNLDIVNKENKYGVILELLNTGDEKALLKLKSIGDKKAQKLVQHRLENGRFNSISDLVQIEGFGEGVVTNLLLKNLHDPS